MCYDIKTSFETQLKRARRFGNVQAIKEIQEKLLPFANPIFYHVSGYSHPKIFIYTNSSPYIPIQSVWGLIPYWVKNEAQFLKFWNSTLNARVETIFEKPSFKYSAKSKRCLIYVDGFYEHHHYKGKVYPFYIKNKDDTPLCLAGLWSEWVNVATDEIFNTFAIITTKGNKFMEKIHNNPKLKEPRMPVILTNEMEDEWLDIGNPDVSNLIQPFEEEHLVAYTVNKLRGNDYRGNVKTVFEEFKYKELVF